MNFKKFFVMTAFCGILFSSVAFAQGVPDSAKSGVVEKSVKPVAAVERNVLQENIFQTLEYPKTDLLMDKDKEIMVKGFQFIGNTLFESAELQSVVAKFTNKPIHFKELQEAVAAINAFYIKKGFFLSRSVLPAQDITNGLVSITIVEGELGEVLVQGNNFYKADFIKEHFFCTVGRVVNYKLLLKSLMILNSYPDLSVKVVMQKGKAPRTVDLVLTVEDKRPLHFFLDYNNLGSKYVSRHRTGTGMEYSNLLVGGDKLTVREVNGIPIRNMGYAQADYSLPVNQYGTRVKGSYAWSSFNVQREFRQLDAGGASQVVSLELAHPLEKTLTSNIDATVGLDVKRVKNYLLGDISSEDKLSILRLGFSGDFLENSTKGRNYYNIVLAQGLSDVIGAKDTSNPSRFGAESTFLKSNIDLARYQQLPFNSTLLLKGSAQLASDVLPVSEQFAVGGLDTVRGFAEAELLGDYGTVLNLELILPPPVIGDYKMPFLGKRVKDVMSFVAFIDHGVTYLKHAMAGENKNSEIVGAGFGTRFDLGDGLNARLEVGFPVAGQESSSGDNAVVYAQVLKKF